MCETPRVVKALYNFKGTNNDELWFSKGDLITLTQITDGGWWEGTLDGKTGWFPSNFVKESKSDARAGARSPTIKKSEEGSGKRESMLTYRDVVIRSLKDTERTFVNDLHLLLQTYLRPLQSDTILSKTEYSYLVGNLEDLASLHHVLLSSLDECAKQTVNVQRIGGLFMNMASQFSSLYIKYCSNHPRAADILQKFREPLTTFMECKGAPPPGIETLTTSLSKPFTRLDKYSSMLKELERHTEESHVDRGDTQRAISVYREIASSCADIRKQKEVEYEIMSSTIIGWEGEVEIHKMGEVLLLSHVRVHSENGEKKEILFLLFSGALVMLSVSPRLSQYMYEGKIPLSGVTVTPLEDTDNVSFAFEITGPMIDKRVVSCGGNLEKNQWVESLRQQAKAVPPPPPAKPQNVTVVSPSPPFVPSVVPPKVVQTAQVAHSLPQKPKVSGVSRGPSQPLTLWSQSCLLPAPPLRPILVGKEEIARSPRSGRKLLGAGKRKPAERALSEDEHVHHHVKRNDPKTLEEDAVILKVIEAYCTSARARHTVNSSILESPQVLIVEEEKIIVEEQKGGQVVIEEKSLVDTVYSLKDQVKELKQDHTKLRKDLDEEKKARKRLENMLRKSLRSIVETNFEENSMSVQS